MQFEELNVYMQFEELCVGSVWVSCC